MKDFNIHEETAFTVFCLLLCFNYISAGNKKDTFNRVFFRKNFRKIPIRDNMTGAVPEMMQERTDTAWRRANATSARC
jgi:hypothetical protein